MSNNIKTQSRTGNSVMNLLTGVFSQIVVLVLNFVVRYIFIQKIGYEYLGINSLFTSILTVLSVADLGFGSALGIVLYSSLSKKNEEEIAGLMNFFKKVYLIIGLIVTGVGLAITPFVKYLVNTAEDIPNLSLYFLLFLLNTVSSYFISYRAILIRADQKNSVVNNVTTIVKVAKAILEIGVLLIIPKYLGLTPTYFFYLGVMVLSTYAIGLITSIYVKKKYPYAFGNKIAVSQEKKSDIISTTKDLFVYRLCTAFSTPIDSIIISVFVGTLVLGIYSNYLLIFTTLMEFICLVSRNVISSVGNFVVERPVEEQKKLYFEIQIIYFAIIIFCTINFVSLVSPFISLVFKEENTLSVWTVFLMGATLISRCVGELAIIFRETTRIYKKTKFISLFYTGLHVGLSLLLGYFLGLEGILLGNVIAYFVTNFWFELYALFKWHFKCSPLKAFGMFFYVLLITCGVSVGSYYLSAFLYRGGTLPDFVFSAIASLLISLVTLLVLYPLTGFKDAYSRIKGIFNRFMEKISFIYKSKKIQLGVLITYFVSLTVLLLLRDLLAIDVHKFIFLGLFVVALLLLNKNNGIALILFTLPISPSLAELFIIIASLGYFVVVSFKNHSIKEWLVILSIPLTIFALELILSASYGTIQINLALRIFVLLSILAVVFYDRSMFTKKHLLAFVFGVLYLFIILAFGWIVPAIYGVTHRGTTRWLTLEVLIRECRFGYSTINWMSKYAFVKYPYTSNMVTNENPNNIGLLSMVCISALYSVYGTFRNKGKIGVVTLIFAFIFFGIWSQSRTFVIVFLSFISLAIILPMITRRKSAISSMIYLSLIVIALAITFMSSPDLIKNIIARFNKIDTASGGERIYLISDYFKFIFSDWKYALFGVGCSNLMPMSGAEYVPHTNFVQFIGAYGLIVFSAFVAFLVLAFKKTKRIKVRSPYSYLALPIVITIGFTFTLQLFLPSIVLLSFIPGVLCLSYCGKDIAKEKELTYLPSVPVLPVKDENLRIAMCSTSFGGGIGSYLVNVCPHLIKGNMDVAFVFNPDTNEQEQQRYKDIESNKYLFKRSWSKIKPIHLQNKFVHYSNSFHDFMPHIIYINASSYLRAFILVCAALNYKGAKIIIHCHEPVNSESKLPFKERLARWFLTFENMVFFACSEETGKVFFGKSFKNEKNSKDAVITNFIDVNRFKFNEKYREAIRKQHDYSNEDVILGSVGRFEEQKNQKFIVELISKLPTKYKALIIGGGGNLKEELINQATQLNVLDRIKLIDSTPLVNQYYCAFDYFVLPSIAEGLPFVSVEAQCSGVLNILNSSLPRSTKISDRVVFLPLDIDSWAQFIANSNPLNLEQRYDAYKQVDEAGFSEDKAPQEIIKKLKEIAYE